MRKPWPSEADARAAVLALCEDRFKKTFGCDVPAGWSEGWAARYKEVEQVEVAARDVARDFNRLSSLESAQERARAFLRELRGRPEGRRLWIPIVEELSQYLAESRERKKAGKEEEPFALDGKGAFEPSDPADRELLRRGRVVGENDHGLVVQLAGGESTVVAGKFGKKSFSAHGVKHRRDGDLGALPDFRTLNGFVVATFEMLSADVPSAWNIDDRPGPTRSVNLFLTDRELAVIAILLDTNEHELTITAEDVAQGKTEGRLLDGHTKKIRSVRQNFGYLQTARPHLSKAERKAWIQVEKKHRQGLRPKLPMP